jgi:pyruvate/2-oxoglutarate/acetoin dehydrogenase E1 component
VPVPFAGSLEQLYIPQPQDIINAVKTVTDWSG